MAPRFFASPYKNAVATTAKKEFWWSELPVSTNAYSDSADLIKASSEYWLAQGSAAGHLVINPYDVPGKFNNRPWTLQVSAKAITDFDVSTFDDLVAAGADDGRISVHALPPLSSFTPSECLSPSPRATLLHPTGRGIDTISFHSTSSSLLLATSKSTTAVFDISRPQPVYVIEQSSPVWSAKWSGDGRLVSTTTKDGFLRLFDVRANSSSPSMETASHQGQKCSRHLWLGGDQIFTTGFSKMRDREYSLFDGRNLGQPLKTQRVDTGTAAFIPVADIARGIVYFAGKGDMNMRWTEIGGTSTFTEGGTSLSIMVAGAALAPPAVCNLMKAEINRLIVLTTDAVVPIPVEVPRRQYIDFHTDLFPPVLARLPAQDAQAWLGGQDSLLDILLQDPSRKPQPIKRVPLPSTPVVVHAGNPAPSPAPTAPARAPLPAQAPLSSSTPINVSQSTPVQISAPARASTSTSSSAPPPLVSSAPPITAAPPKASPPPVGAAPPPTPSPTFASPPSTPAPIQTTGSTPARAPSTPSSPATPFNPGWSRKFLKGKTPLKPDYHDVHGLSATLGADVQMLKANELFFFFPLAGAGGRLGVHPLVANGRLPTHIPSLVCGASLVDFELDPFDPHRVFCASDDSKIRVFRIPDGGLEEDLSEAVLTIHDPKMDRVHELKHHPIAANLLLSVSDDHGTPTLRLWDVEKGTTLKEIKLPMKGVSSTNWSPDGDLLAIASKSKTLVVLDPRSSAPPLSTSSHDSIRPVRVVWLSPTHIVTTGFSRSATRELILYAVAPGTSLTRVASQSLDVTPAPLFPFADLDTNILLLYSKGERSCHAYEVHPAAGSKAFAPLPSFEPPTGTLQSGFAFLPKQGNDVRKVEVIRSLRLTPSTVEVVSFCIPRAREEFFQDDVFGKTKRRDWAVMTAQEWVAGREGEAEWLELRPQGMTLLSEAPMTAAKASTRNKIMGPVVTESQKQEAYLDKLFQAAQVDEDDDEVGRKTNVGMAAPEDDDW